MGKATPGSCWRALLWGALLLPGVLYAQSAAQLVDEGDHWLARGAYQEAEKTYQEALAQDATYLPAYLGMVRLAMARKNWRQASTWARKALRIDSSSLAAHYFLAISERERAQYQTPFQFMHRKTSRKHFEWVLARDSLYRDVLYQYALLYRQDTNYARAITLAEAQVRLRPDLDEAAIGLFRLYHSFLNHTDLEKAGRWLAQHPTGYARFFEAERLRRLGQLQEADRAFRRLQQTDVGWPPQAIALARARIWTALNRPDSVQAIIDRAIHTISSALDARFLFEDFKYIFNLQELATYRHLQAPEAYRTFFQAFWERRDPMPGRPINMRLVAHYRRLLVAERDYVYDGPRLWHSNPDKFGELKLPPTYFLNQEFNDKGLIFIRHGAPDDRIVTVRGEVNPFRSGSLWREREFGMGWVPNESWRYYQPRMDFHFVIDEGATGNNWRLTPVLANAQMIEDREIWGPPYSRIMSTLRTKWEVEAGLRPPQPTTLELFELREALVAQSQAAYTRGLTSDQYRWPANLVVLPLEVLPVAFRGPADSTQVYLYYALPAAPFRKVTGRRSGYTRAEVGFAVHDTAWQPLVTQLQQRTLPILPDPTAALNDFMVVTLQPGTYRLTLHGRSLESERLQGRVQMELTVPDLREPGLQMSDLLPAWRILPASGPSRFVRNGWHLWPNPLRRFSVSQPVHLYFEIYGLTPDAQGRTRYTVEYILRPIKPRKKFFGLFGRDDRPVLRLKSTHEDPHTELSEHAELDVHRVDPGDYVLEVRITDARTGATISRTLALTLTE
ncbi:tetratricopeptide repeat protein [Rhodothermus profundi]|uniref:GWxTD domain-containing protein n=1 Tax=Rhodothermus profundi TaxID=633813 RepID=A0A1M6UJ11_9BACT|nr:GWxTD domain-containing protein [Rhodothermus profundi]SHK69156.1 GWxTD domain-containing protein [Rhodothermus profundi]